MATFRKRAVNTEPVNTGGGDHFMRAVARFSARCIEARVEFFQARAPWIPWLQAVPQIRVWRLLVRGPVRVHHLSCRHGEIFSEHHLPALVALVNRVLKDDRLS
jgi:thioesterase domain-containing protein